LVPPGGGSHHPQPKKGGTYRFYLARNAYDGWSGEGTKDGGYNVVYVNGVQPIKGAGLQGSWQGAEVWDAGEKRTAEPAKLLQITFRGDQFEVQYEGEKMLAGRFSVDDGKTPKRLTLETVTSDGESATIPAIYEIEGQKFTLCHPNHEGGDRPSTFSPSKSVVLAVLTKKNEGEAALFSPKSAAPK
ncbi:MAG: TIGR03067 domain-containing protein, partial [Verrucomicrobiales bacterium]